MEYIILWIIKSGNIYWAEIIEVLKKWDLIVAEGTIYPLLSRLKKDWMIDYYWVESETGHPRKYFNLTETWKENLIIMENNWLGIKKAVKNILNK